MAESDIAAGQLPASAAPAVSVKLKATHVFNDSRGQPMRTVVFDPASALGVGSGSSGTGKANSSLLAVGSNARSLTLVRVPAATGSSDAGTSVAAASAPSASSLAVMEPVHKWRDIHAGSVYAAAWAAHPGVASAAGSAAGSDGLPPSALLATCSNDSTVRVVRWVYEGGHASEGRPTQQLAAQINTDAGTLRDLAWLGAPASEPGGLACGTADVAPLCLAVAGGGDFGIRFYDVSAGFAPPYALPSHLEGRPVVLSTGASTSSPSPLLTKLLGHTDTVHSLRPWGRDGRSLVSVSADGTVRLWDTRAPRHAVCFALSDPVASPSSRGGAGSSLLGGGAALPTSASGAGRTELHSLSLRRAFTGSSASPGPCEVAVGAADGSVAVLDLVAGRMLASSRVHGGEVRSVDAAGPLTLSASFDGTVAVSACSAGGSLSLLSAARDHRDKVLCARWHPLSAVAASSSADKTVMLWSVQVAKLTA